MYAKKPLPNPYSPANKITFQFDRDKQMAKPIYVKPDPTGDELLDEMLDLQAYRAHQVDVRKYDAALEANIRKLQSRYHYVSISQSADTQGCILCPPNK